MSIDAKKSVQRLQRLEYLRKTIDQQWDEIRKYITPYRGQFFKDSASEHSIEWKQNRFIFDSTAVNACNTLAASLHGSLTSPAVRWFDLRFRDSGLNRSKAVSMWLEEATKITYDSLRESNFDMEVNETYIDLVSMGTSIMTNQVVETADGDLEKIIYKATPVKECYFEQDWEGRVIRFYRKMRWSPLQIVDKFMGMPNADIGDGIIQRAESGDNDMDINIAYIVCKTDDADTIDTTKILAPENRPYQAGYVLLDEQRTIGATDGYYSMPANVARWRVTADSMWGNSPAMAAMADVMTLNYLVELILASLEKVVDPAIMTTERGLLSSLDLGPAGVNVLRRMDELAPFESRARFDVSELHREKLQASIRQAFYVDQLELKDSPAMTATEVSVRYELMQRLIGPTLGRLKVEFLDPLIRTHFSTLYRYKKLPPLPEELGQAGRAILDITYTGPMSRVQRSDQAQSITQTLASVLPVAEAKPEILDVFDFDETARTLHDLYQAPAAMLASDMKIKKVRDERKQKMEQMRQAELEEKRAKAGKQGGGTPSGTPPAAMGGMQ